MSTAVVAKRKRNVSRACVNCRNSKTKCSESRPCTRCVEKSIEETCVDAPRNRGKRRKRSHPNLTFHLCSPNVEGSLIQQLVVPNKSYGEWHGAPRVALPEVVLHTHELKDPTGGLPVSISQLRRRSTPPFALSQRAPSAGYLADRRASSLGYYNSPHRGYYQRIHMLEDMYRASSDPNSGMQQHQRPVPSSISGPIPFHGSFYGSNSSRSSSSGNSNSNSRGSSIGFARHGSNHANHFVPLRSINQSNRLDTLAAHSYGQAGYPLHTRSANYSLPGAKAHTLPPLSPAFAALEHQAPPPSEFTTQEQIRQQHLRNIAALHEARQRQQLLQQGGKDAESCQPGADEQPSDVPNSNPDDNGGSSPEEAPQGSNYPPGYSNNFPHQRTPQQQVHPRPPAHGYPPQQPLAPRGYPPQHAPRYAASSSFNSLMLEAERNRLLQNSSNINNNNIHNINNLNNINNINNINSHSSDHNNNSNNNSDNNRDNNNINAC